MLAIGIGLNSIAHRRRGPTNLVVNGAFSSGLSGWSTPSGNWSVVAGQAVMADTASYTPLTQTVLTTGVSYTATFDVVAVTGMMTLRTNAGASIHLTFGTIGAKSVTFTAAGPDVGFSRSTTGGMTIDNVVIIQA